MCSLEKFSPLPAHGFINVCELEGKVQSLPPENGAGADAFTNTVLSHPRVNIVQEFGIPSSLRLDATRVFVPVSDGFLKRVVNTWYEDGIFAALSEASRVDANQTPGAVHKIAQSLLKIIQLFTTITDKAKSENLTASVSQCRDWQRSPIRCIDWHPHANRLAVAACNDSVRVFTADHALVPILKSQAQTAISCLAWRPYSASELAVGCQKGVLLWTVDPASVVARPSMSCAQVLQRDGHSPVTSVAWAPQGDLLVTASAADLTMFVWDTAQERTAPLRRVGGGGVCLLAWAPSAERLCAATVGSVFRVWCTQSWTPERWSTPCGRVHAACWSPSGSVLLFATSEEALIYALRFDSAGSAIDSPDVRDAKPVIDLTPVTISEEGDRAGGLVATMAWDPRGLHLAVTFADSAVVAVFRTHLGILFRIAPCCFVNGQVGEIPSTIAFQKNFDEGSVLSIAWSSGRLQHFPLICSDLDMTAAASQHFVTSPSASFNKSPLMKSF